MEFTEQDMKKVNNTEEDFVPGNYLCPVAKVIETKSNAGDEQWKIMFEEAESGRTIVWDNLTFGASSKGIAFLKLKQLGVGKNKEGVYKVDPKDLDKKEVNLTLIENTYKNDGSLQVYGFPPTFGYSEADVPF